MSAKRPTNVDIANFITSGAPAYFQGHLIATPVVKVATADEGSAEEFARSLGNLRDQQVFGMKTARNYRSICMG
jgi:hypothetical protein